jgi:hypothetical protein
LVPQIFCSSTLHQFVHADADKHVEILGFDANALPLLDLARQAAGDVGQSGHTRSPSKIITAGAFWIAPIAASTASPTVAARFIFPCGPNDHWT